jgi:multiple sugar transport system substrate-binding protein
MKRPLALLAIVLATTLAVSGCGRTDAPDDDGRLTIDDSAATGEITVWTAGGNGAKLDPFITAFEADNPDATIEVTDIPWNEVTTKITSALAAGTEPDLVLVGLPDVAMLIATDEFQPVADGVVDASGILSDVQVATEHDGLSYAVPWFVETRLFCYRKDFATLAGATAPTTWDELLAFSDALRTLDTIENPILVPIGPDQRVGEFLMPLLAQAGGSAMNDDGTAFTLDTPEMVAALEFYGRLFAEGHASPGGTTGGNPIGDALAGRVAAFYVGTWIIPAIVAQVGQAMVDSAVACITVPAGSAGNASHLGAATWAVPRDAENADGAFKFVRSLVTLEAQQALFDATHEIPALTAAWEHPPLQDDPWIATALTQLDSVIVNPPVPSWNELEQTIGAEAEKVARGASTPEEAAAAMQQKADELGLGW